MANGNKKAVSRTVFWSARFKSRGIHFMGRNH